MLEAMSKDKTLLQELVTEQKKGTSEIVKGIKKSADVFAKFGKDMMDQFSRGELKLGPISAINSLIMPNIDRYRAMTAQGQAFGGSIIQMRRTMTSSGQSLDQFSNMVTSGQQGVRMLGMNDLAKFSKTVIGANAALGDLGLSVDGVNEYMGAYLENLRLQGRMGTLNADEMNKSYRQFVVDVTDIAHNLGISREEATRRLNERAKDPETTFLAAVGGLSAQQRSAFDTLQAQYGNSPMMKKVLRDAFLNTIMPGYGRSIDVNAALAGQPGGEQAWQGIVSGVRNAINNPTAANTNAQAGLIGNSFNRLAGRPNQSQLGAFISGNLNGQDIRSTRNALDLKMEVLSANVKQIADNSKSAPTENQLGGTDEITRELSKVDKSAQNLANAFQQVQNDLLEANQKFLANMLKLQNNITNSVAGLTRSSSSAATSWTGGITDFLSKGVGIAASHPLLSLGVGGAGAAGLSYLKARSASKTADLVKNMLKSKFSQEAIEEELAKRSFLGRIVNAARSGNILSGIGNGIRSAGGSLLRATSFLKNTGSLSRLATLGELVPGLGLGGVALAAGGAGIGAGELTGIKYSSIWTSHKADETEAQKRELDRNRWRSYGSILGTGIGGGLGAYFTGGLGTFAGAAAGSATLGGAAGWLYDALHPEQSQNNNKLSDQLKPDNTDNQGRPTTGPDPLSDIIGQLRNLNDNISSNSMTQDKSLSDIVSRLDDLNRIVKSNGNRIQ